LSDTRRPVGAAEAAGFAAGLELFRTILSDDFFAVAGSTAAGGLGAAGFFFS